MAARSSPPRTSRSSIAMEKAGKLKRIPFTDRAQMKALVDPVMAAYAKEIGADRIYAKIKRDQVRRNLSAFYHRLLTWLMVGTVAVLIVPVTLQIISRYTALIPSWIWTEELSRFLFIWMVMLGAMIGVREGTHFEVDVWPELGSRRPRAAAHRLHLFVLVFALVFRLVGLRSSCSSAGTRHSELAELPMGFIFAAWPVAGLTWALFLGESFLDNFRILAGKSRRMTAVALRPAWRRWSCSARSSCC